MPYRDGQAVDPRYVSPIDMWAQCPKFYLSERDVTIQLGFTKIEMHTVIEFNTWKGEPNQDFDEIERTRYTVLLDHDDGFALLAVYRKLIDGEEAMLDALCRLTDLYAANPGYSVVLSHDARLGVPLFKLSVEK